MTKEDWNIVKAEWPNPHGVIKLNCDGYEVMLAGIIHKLKLVHVVYINNWLKGEWMNGECEEGRRFYRRQERFLYSVKERISAKKHLGKAAYKRYGYDKKYVSHHAEWISFASFKKHIEANNKEISLVLD